MSTFGIDCFPLVQRPRALGRQGHQILIVQSVSYLGVQPLDERQLLLLGQLAHGLLNFRYRTHASRITGIMDLSKRGRAILQCHTSRYGLATRFPRSGAAGRWERGDQAALARIALPNARSEARSRGLRFFAIAFIRP